MEFNYEWTRWQDKYSIKKGTEVWNSIMNEQDDNVSDEYSNKVVVAYNWLPILLSY